MVLSLKRLLGESIDYSGLIGPDQVSVEEALERFLQYREGPGSWIVSRFVCPAKQLVHLAHLLTKSEIETSFQVSVLAEQAPTAQAWENELANCAGLMNAFESATPEVVEVAAFEICPPATLAPAQVLKDLNGFSEVDVFIEPAQLDQLEPFTAAIAESEWAYLKLDLSKTRKPNSYTVAKLLHEAVAMELPFKIVQERGSPLTNEREFGSINLAAAVAHGLSEDLSSREMEAVLNGDDIAHWRFSADAITFRGWEAAADAIEQARDLFVQLQCPSVEYVLHELGVLGFAVPEEA